MGVLSDLVVADEGDAEKLAATLAPADALGGIDIKGIDPVKLASLHSLFTERPAQELLSLYIPTVGGSGGGPWVFAIPPDLVQRLGRLATSERQFIAERWAGTPEFSRGGWSPSVVARTFGAICDQASKAVSSRRTLFLWMCL